jgi:hypothetical protein
MLTVDEVVTAAELHWRRSGIARSDRDTMSRDLRQELDAAAADGADMHDLTSGDIPAFARDIAAAAGATAVPFDTRPVLVAALLGALPGLVTYVMVWWLPDLRGIRNDWPPTLFSDPHGHAVFQLVEYVIIPLIVITGAVTAVWWRRRQHAAIGRTLAALALLLPIAWLCTVGIFLVIVLPGLFNTFVIGTALLALATAVARRWAVTSSRGTLSTNQVMVDSAH